MRQRWLLNLALLVLVGMLAWAVAQRRGVELPAATLLTALDARTVTRVRIQLPGQPEIALERDAADWRLVAPLRARAHAFKVEQLVGLAGAASELRLAADAAELSKFGLAPPQARLWFGEEQIEIGDPHPFKSARYVRYRDTVHLVSAPAIAPSAYGVTDLVSPRLLAPQRELVEIALPRLTVRHEGDRWVAQPAETELSADRINAWVNEWQRAQALAVVPYSGRPIRDRIRLTVREAGADPPPLVVTLGILSERPEFVLYREDEGLEYRFPEQVGRRLLHLGSE